MESDAATYLPWFILREIPFLGNQGFKRLVQAFGTPEKALAAKPEAWIKVAGISKKIIPGSLQASQYTDTAQRELQQITALGVKILTLHDPGFPGLLKTIPDPPPILTYQGHVDPRAPCIAIVGSRNASSYGMDTARYLARRLADMGFCIVSGMARGIDTAAHTGALESTGNTIAVLGSGLKKIYPRENKDLFYRMQTSGAVISEFKLDTDPYPYNFPIRNRIIAGLSCGTIVVEAKKKSGSLITARLAAEYNREVFAVPGSIRSRKSQGTHSLLKQGAKLVENEADVVNELSHLVHQEPVTGIPLAKPVSKPELDATKKQIMQVLEVYPRHIDSIIESSRMDSGIVSAVLLELELLGIVKHHPGTYFSIVKE
jgi:DNA processing protein